MAPIRTPFVNICGRYRLVEEDWLVATSNKIIPTLHSATAAGLKLRPQSEMKVQCSAGDLDHTY